MSAFPLTSAATALVALSALAACASEGFAGENRPERPVVMLRFASSQTRSMREWKGTARVLAENRGCCDDIWFSTGESFPSLDWHQTHLVCLKEAAEDVRRLGIGVSLQFEATIGHGDNFPTDEEKRLFDKPWTGWTGADGTECVYCSCPRQPGFLKRLAEVSEAYAVIRPDVVWIDDDLRPMNHYPVRGKDALGCWCATCVAAFSAEEGRTWTREKLAAAYRTDAALRDRWDDFACRSLADAACTIARAFRRVSPRTRMGLQTGFDRDRLTKTVVRALAKATGEAVSVRMGGSSYYDLAPYGVLAFAIRKVAARARLGLEDVTDNWCTEVETYPRAYGSRSVRSIAYESFASMAWGFDTTSVFAMDRRSETDDFYSRFLLRPLVAVTAFLNDYRAANRGTEPAGFACPEMAFDDTRRLTGLPLLPGLGKTWGRISAEREQTPVWGTFRRDLLPAACESPSAKIQAVRDMLSSAAPVRLCSPFCGLLLPRVAADGAVRTIGLIGARLDVQEKIVVAVETTAASAVWRELGQPPTNLPITEANGRRQVTISSLGAWNIGYLSFDDAK